ncbi:MAG: VWA domain-containing protein [Bacteriovoracaceae bacterium]|nr:VWA domain-containing protein [Bacteriovoracaceae bacterium]
MKYGNLQFIWLLWLIPALVIFYVWAHKKKQVLIDQFLGAELKERLLQHVSFARQKVKSIALILCVLFAILSLIGPKWGFHWEEVKRRGVDVLVALDVSGSMLAQDVSPNRLERAKREIMDLLNIMQGDRVGLIAFAGSSFLQSPLTLDYGAVQIFLDDLSTDLIPVPGTAIGEAIEMAVKSFDQNDKKSRVLILITDGEDHGQKPVEAAKAAAEAGVKIYTIGIGKEGGAPIPLKKGGGFKKNRAGEVIITHLDEETLQKIALGTGGSYVRSVTGDLDLEKIYEDITKNVEDKELKSGRRKRFEMRFQWPLFIAIMLLIFEALYGEKSNRHKLKRRWWKFLFRSKHTTALLLLILILPIVTFAKNEAEELYAKENYSDALKDFIDEQIEQPGNLDLQYNMANTYYKMKQYDKAKTAYQQTAFKGDNALAQKSYYNLGNVAYRLGKLQEAVDFYKKALDLDPTDEDTQHNLEFVREEIKRRIEENKKRQQKQKQQNQQNQQQDPNQQQQQQDPNQQQQQQQQGQKQQGQKPKPDDKQDKKQGDKDKEGDKGKQKDKDKKQEGGSAKQGQQKSKEEDKDQKKQGEKKAHKMSKEEAQRWLDTLDEDRKKHLRRQMQQGGGPRRVEKDW